MNQRLIPVLSLLLLVPVLTSCETAEEEFVSDRLLKLCNDSYWICNRPSSCVLDENHYVEGAFPGVRRVVLVASQPNTTFRVRIFLKNMKASGTELLLQLYETDCTLFPDKARAHLIDVDIFDEAGDDRILTFNLKTTQQGEHLLELYSDASSQYLLTAEPK